MWKSLCRLISCLLLTVFFADAAEEVSLQRLPNGDVKITTRTSTPSSLADDSVCSLDFRPPARSPDDKPLAEFQGEQATVEGPFTPGLSKRSELKLVDYRRWYRELKSLLQEPLVLKIEGKSLNLTWKGKSNRIDIPAGGRIIIHLVPTFPEGAPSP